ncbi:MAG: hypothetical protein KDD58_12825 [Bdellovibrionales bacterium]|nr:hypothetical protein [Bdellovibrionales bacterium]
MNPLILSLVALLAIMVVEEKTFANESDVSCKAGWAYELYSECENLNKPIPKEGNDPSVCGYTEVELENHPICGVAAYKRCKEIYDFENWNTVNVIQYQSAWVAGYKDDDLKGQPDSVRHAWYCQKVVDNWNKENNDKSLRAIPIGLVTNIPEPDKTIWGIKHYKYTCNLRIEKGDLKLVANKRDKACGVETYKSCTVKQPKTCVHKVFATEYEKDRRPECGNENVVYFGFEGQTFEKLKGLAQEGLASASCLSCDSVEDLVEKADCLVENHMQFYKAMDEEQNLSYLENLVEAVNEVTASEEVRKQVERFVLLFLDGLKVNIDQLQNEVKAVDSAEKEQEKSIQE